MKNLVNPVPMIGRRFHRLLVLSRAPSKQSGSSRASRWLCRCDCGTEKVIGAHELRREATRSCGCLMREAAKKTCIDRTKHGMSQSSTYRVWANVIARCTNPNERSYPNYGGRGIKICDRWLQSFEFFLEDMGERPARLTLDRKNNDGDYELGNCRWATRAEQNRNKRTNVWVMLGVKRVCFSDACKMLGVERTNAATLRAYHSFTAQQTIDFYITQYRDHAARLAAAFEQVA